MKTLFLTISLLAVFSTSTFATHAYRSQRCVSESHFLYYKGNYPLGGMYGMTLLNQEDESSALPTEDVDGTNGELDADVTFTVLSNMNIVEPVEKNECWFDHSEWKSKQVVQVNTISAGAAKKLGLKKGEKITFICEETTDFPNGDQCEK